MPDSRSEFENWAVVQSFSTEKYSDGTYVSDFSQSAWEGWQAREASLMARIPVEALERSIQVLENKLIDLPDATWSAQAKAELRTHISALTQLLEQKQ